MSSQVRVSDKTACRSDHSGDHEKEKMKEEVEHRSLPPEVRLILAMDLHMDGIMGRMGYLSSLPFPSPNHIRAVSLQLNVL